MIITSNTDYILKINGCEDLKLHLDSITVADNTYRNIGNLLVDKEIYYKFSMINGDTLNMTSDDFIILLSQADSFEETK